MAKDAWKNQPNYKIGGGTLNEYEFNQQHGALTEQERAHLPGQSQGQPGNESDEPAQGENDLGESPEARHIRLVTEAAHEKVVRRGGAQKTSGAKKPKAAKKAAKKSAAKGVAKSAKRSSAKGGAKKSVARKGAAKKSSSTKKSGAKRSSAKKSGKGAGSRGTAKGARSSGKAGAKKSAGAKQRGARGRSRSAIS
jgi:hypothetical protein